MENTNSRVGRVFERHSFTPILDKERGIYSLFCCKCYKKMMLPLLYKDPIGEANKVGLCLLKIKHKKFL